MSPLEQQHAAEALSFADLATIGVGGFLTIAVFTLGNQWRKGRADRRRRMDDRKYEVWKRGLEEEAAKPERMNWADALDFPWPSEIDRREPTLRLVEPSDRFAA